MDGHDSGDLLTTSPAVYPIELTNTCVPREVIWDDEEVEEGDLLADCNDAL